MIRYKQWIALFMLILMPTGLLGLHHFLGRPQRIEAAQRKHDLLTVRDQILRFEYEQETELTSLDQLVPAFLQDEHLTEQDGTALYHYDPAKRFLIETKQITIGGLYTRYSKPLSTLLPAIENRIAKTTRHIPTQSDTNDSQPNVKQQQPPALPQTKNSQLPSHTTSLPTPPDDSIDSLTIKIKPAFDAKNLIAPKRLKDSDIHAQLRTPKGAALTATPPGAIVFEAEHFTEMNFGWEVHEDPACGGGAYLHCKEGIANTEGQVNYRLGNFYDVGNQREPTYLRYHLHIPEAKRYRIFARFWATGFHCSNKILIGVDSPRWSGHELGSRQPYRWQWSPWLNGSVTFSKGDHFLNISIHEDGVRIDQFMLVPTSVASNKPFSPNIIPGEHTAWSKSNNPIHISYDIKSLVLSKEAPMDCRIILRHLPTTPPTEKTDSALIRVTLEDAGPNSSDIALLSGPIKLDALPHLSVLPLSFDRVDLAALPRREYLLKTEIIVEGKTLAVATLPLLKPFKWEVFGPGGYLSNNRTGPLDGNGTPKAGDNRTWHPFKSKAWTHWGVLDFGLHFDSNSLHPRRTGTLYANTKIQVPEDGTYLFKIQADDQIRLWLDGKDCFRNETQRPVTRSGSWHNQYLAKGPHTLRIRLNQRGGRWQASLRIRTLDDQLCNVTGIE